MNQQEKDQRFKEAQKELAQHIFNIRSLKSDFEMKNKKLKKEYKDLPDEDKFVQGKMYTYQKKRIEDLTKVIPSPYFMKVFLEGEDEFFLGKFAVPEEHIYSWVSPIAALRFAKPGKVAYKGPDSGIRTGRLLQKDQFMITNEKILFFASESEQYDRELIYQDYFSRQKTGFILPEIVAQMEEAQDKVIRAHPKGSLLISGPAGSGKTTLALHRVAYLAQSPELSEHFKAHSIIVFVQDKGSKEYFSALLPDLGIHGVNIMTFFEWGSKILDLGEKFEDVYRFGESEKEKDLYEYKKKQAFAFIKDAKYSRDFYSVLESIYANVFGVEEKEMFQRQKNQFLLDRFDMVILLTLFKKQFGALTMMQEYYKMKGEVEAEKSIGRFPISYSLMIFDEFQNYLPEEIMLGRSVLSEEYSAAMYVGDIAQQTKLFSLEDWSEVHENLLEERKVVLGKVYRNTKNILQYIEEQGYSIEIPEKIKEGEDVIEKIFESREEEKEYIYSVLEENKDKQVGLLVRDKKYFGDFDLPYENVHALTLNEAQGLEFDVVIFAQFDKGGDFEDLKAVYPDLYEQKLKQEKDLKYVGLTRAIEKLVVLKQTKKAYLIKIK